MTNVDDDAPGVLVQPTTGQTSEDGASATFEIFLTSQPQADVVIDLTSSDVDEGTVSPVRDLYLGKLEYPAIDYCGGTG